MIVIVMMNHHTVTTVTVVAMVCLSQTVYCPILTGASWLTIFYIFSILYIILVMIQFAHPELSLRAVRRQQVRRDIILFISVYYQDSDDSFQTACDETASLETNKICGCSKCPELSDCSCCQHFLKLKQNCQGQIVDIGNLMINSYLKDLGLVCVTEVPRFLKMMDKVNPTHRNIFESNSDINMRTRHFLTGLL